MIFKFNKHYFFAFLFLLITEIFIALYVHDQIIRPYIGDLLVVILLYCFIKSFVASAVFQTAVAVLIFAFAVEALQYIGIVQKLGLQDSKTAGIILGSSFDWKDMLAYTIGILLLLLTEYVCKKRQTKKVTVHS
jgi:hypothetical protein